MSVEILKTIYTVLCFVSSLQNAAREVYKTLKKGDAEFGYDLGKDVR